MGKSSDDEVLSMSATQSRREWLEAQAAAAEKDPATSEPVEIPAAISAPPSLEARLQRYVRYELSHANQQSGLETFDEFDDFEVDDDFDGELASPHEMSQMAEDMPRYNGDEAEREAWNAALSSQEPHHHPGRPEAPPAGAGLGPEGRRGDSGGVQGTPKEPGAGPEPGGTKPPDTGNPETVQPT